MDIKVPAMGESVTEGTLANWLVKPGQVVKQDDPIAEIETDKVAIEVPAPAAGVITEQLVQAGETVQIGKIIAKMTEGGTAAAAPAAPAAGPREERVKMTRLRQTIARRLKEAQNTAAMLTTFNDVDMSEVMELRNQYKDAFEKKHGVKLGFMGFFVKACVGAEGDPGGQCRDRRHGHHLQELLQHRRRRRHGQGPRRPRRARRRHPVARRASNPRLAASAS
jgi:2-oxoglutarate dehydrogenase E2 component (dihydrolipoamide succinyltransferase)